MVVWIFMDLVGPDSYVGSDLGSGDIWGIIGVKWLMGLVGYGSVWGQD